MGLIGIGKFDFSELQSFVNKANEKLGQEQMQEFVQDCAKEIAARLLREVMERTPRGKYTGGEYTCDVKKGPTPLHHSRKEDKKGGTLRNGWTLGEITRKGDKYCIEIFNPVEYATYVEKGHRTKRENGYGWAEGHFMLTISKHEIQKSAPDILERKIQKKLGELFK